MITSEIFTNEDYSIFAKQKNKNLFNTITYRTEEMYNVFDSFKNILCELDIKYPLHIKDFNVNNIGRFTPNILSEFVMLFISIYYENSLKENIIKEDFQEYFKKIKEDILEYEKSINSKTIS